ncbi:MAG: hypothetical protein ACD_70C00024G0004 [uncultured bacterium]|nr:MAG: hypothetical protein ACD_70C00024G0004 [uncultured bacterium]OGT25210.1 MAG: 3-deoxy-manno-octulosonate cytidylyltransferase [Gammaproteobacteria bacterium RIFCSPHIGHO2_02_FULL_42_43]OGT29180.1 MAG: 3-deoxy-manno-octulosonate cytidylyltransferase [Gammaproteobacteria bacterium RIFCSPHIGHO2_01_FULL_42_8]OGT51163.1 MAG: 3-deoxy-manno-octulosonate cytidylyltransferase [Gammaproteobacteria bacterium RIFCSPHIGHO2_12_FULL_41_25]OGT62925.1 MAG: 3-deoxy-manno-octulosonate cytidylyltransferase [
MTNFHIIIPARLNSQRLPGKVLLDIRGKPMVQHVFERATEAGADSVTIATDDEQVASVCEKFGANVCMTQSSHRSGTERIAEAAASIGFDEDEIVVCLQADEPHMPAPLIAQVAALLAEHDHVKVATLATPLKNSKELFNPNVVKVIFNYRNVAIYFSRAPIPWERDRFSEIWTQTRAVASESIQIADAYYRHIGLYAYRAEFLETYSSWSACALEQLESLEQLRILWNGYRIHVGLTDVSVPAGVDTPADLERVRTAH